VLAVYEKFVTKILILGLLVIPPFSNTHIKLESAAVNPVPALHGNLYPELRLCIVPVVYLPLVSISKIK